LGRYTGKVGVLTTQEVKQSKLKVRFHDLAFGVAARHIPRMFRA
jgi:hypothetical protein